MKKQLRRKGFGWLERLLARGETSGLLHTHEVTGSSPVVSTTIEDLCNGSTPDSDSVCGGSNPSSSAKKSPIAYAIGDFLASDEDSNQSKSKQSGGLFD